MAVTLPVRLSARIVDGLNVEAFTHAYGLIDPSATWTAVLSFLSDWLSALDACIDGQILEGTITALPELPGGLKSSPVSTSRVEQNGILSFTATGSSYRWSELLPALSDDSGVQHNGKLVTSGGSPVATLVGVLLGGSGSFEWTNANQQALAAFKDSQISFRKYNRQLSVATYETA